MEELPQKKTCPACGDDVAKGFGLDGYQVAICGGCGLGWVLDDISPTHVSDVYGDAYFEGGGAGYNDYEAEGKLLVKRGAKYGRILGKFCETGTLLDVGAAAGYLMEGFRGEGWEVRGIEPNETMAKSARARGLDVETGAFEDFRGGDGMFDAVAMVQVVAHLWDAGRAFEFGARLLRPGGLLLVETWDRRSVAARVFGKGWHEYSPPSTLRWFTRKSLEKMIEKSGFHLVASRRTVKSISFGHARSLASAKWKLARLGLKAAAWVPKGLEIPYLMDDLFWSVFRKGSPEE